MRTLVTVGLLTGRRAVGTSVLPLFSFISGKERVSLPAVEWKREAATPALAERRSLGQDIETKARFRDSFLAQWFPVVIRRPGPRRAKKSLEVSLRLCVSAPLR